MLAKMVDIDNGSDIECRTTLKHLNMVHVLNIPKDLKSCETLQFNCGVALGHVYRIVEGTKR